MPSKYNPFWLHRLTTYLRGSNLFIRSIAALIIYCIIGSIAYVMWLIISYGHDFIGKKFVWEAHEASAPTPAASSKTDLKNTHLNPDPLATLNPSWRDRFSEGNGRIASLESALSASGYPLIRVLKPTAVCMSPLNSKLASDLQRANRIADVERIDGCLVLDAGAEAEWTDPNPFNNGSIALRLHPQSGLPFTVYGPSPNGEDSPFFRWFGRLVPQR